MYSALGARAFRHKLACFAMVALGATSLTSQGQDLQRLRGLLDSVPPGSWVQANVTSFSSAFPVGSVAVPSSGISDPGRVVRAWSGFTWDSNRGNLLMFGGGHYNYLGNEMYWWNGSTGIWSRGSLPSAVASPDYMVPDNSAPQSAHTYDNNMFLPLNDRFFTFGGATHPYGGTFRAVVNGVEVRTGPWMWDPKKADVNKVGGSNGSGYDPATLGGSMWTDRRLAQNGAALASAINGTTAYREENGKDVIYVTSDGNQTGQPGLYRYTVGNVAAGESDQIEWIGRTFNGVAHEGAGTIDTLRNLYVRTAGHPELANDLIVWRLAGASSTSLAIDFDVDLVNPDGSPFSFGIGVGIDYDEELDQYFAWDGTQRGTVYTFKAETDANGNLLKQWHVTTLQSPSLSQPIGRFENAVFGKWKYVKQLSAFVALDEYYSNTGDAGVWLYKPATSSTPPVVNVPPSVNMTAPTANSNFDVGGTVTLSAAASDTDGNVVKVEFFDGQTLVGTATAQPYTATWTVGALGAHSLTARATDNVGGQSTSAAVSVSVGPSGPQAICAAEGGVCKIPGGAMGHVYYGVNGLFFVKRNLTGNVACTSQNFGGDPAPGQYKSCYLSLVTQGGNIPPSITLTSPTATGVYAIGANVALTAAASDLDGSIVKVEFFDGTTSLGTATTAPYTVNWTTVLGAHSFTAQATDNLGAKTTSEAVGVLISTTTFCAAEGAFCTLPAGSVGNVYFGANGKFASRMNLTGSIACVTQNFGGADPAPGLYKSCFYALTDQGNNVAPTVTLTSPTSTDSYSAGTTVVLAATAADSDGSVTKVEFFDGANLLGSVASAPYTLNWTATLGAHSFTARVTDNIGAQITSAPVAVSITTGNNTTLCAAEEGVCALPPGAVGDVYFGANGLFAVKSNVTGNVACTTRNFGGDPAPGQYKSCYYALTNQGNNVAPTVALTSPTATDTYAAGATVVLTANAADSDGSITKVEFFDGATSLGSVTGASSYSVNWTATLGAHSFTAKATDNLGAQTTSQAVALSITTGNNTILCAAEGAVCKLPAGAVADVYFGANGLFAVRSNLTGNVACTTQFFGGDPAPGKYKSCYYAATNQGSNVAPTVALISPTASDNLSAGNTVALSATAADADGSVARVEFFDGATSLGSVTSAPYTLNWTATLGAHSFTAQATDNLGAQTTSAAVAVSITSGNNTIFCAAEGAVCKVPAGAVADVYFGASGLFAVKRNMTGNVACTPQNFGGDPAPNQAKSCYYALTNQGNNVAPTVALTAPTATGSYDAGTTVVLSATTADSGGSVAKVEFFDGTTSLGSVTTAPYSLNWTATLGAHNFSAQATDNLGAQTTSAPVAVSITTGANFTFCAAEESVCALPAGVVADVYFGVTGPFVIKRNATGNVQCNVRTFGSDPAPGKYKSCSYIRTN
ncbi:hypothetical protein BH11PSE9_BH11PSE9_17870 [soil metagenome]